MKNTFDGASALNYSGYGSGRNIDLVDIVLAIRRHARLIVLLPVLGACVAFVISLQIRPTFTSVVTLLPPQQPSSGAGALLGQLGAIAGGINAAALKTPGDIYVGMLESRTVTDKLIGRFDLLNRYKVESMDAARTKLKSVRHIEYGKKDGLISVLVSDIDPKFAANLANAHVEELQQVAQSMAVTEASQRRLFYEKQLKDAGGELAAAEMQLRQTQEKTGMLLPDGQVQAIIAGAAQLRAAIASKEVELESMRTWTTARNPNFIKASEELRALQKKLEGFETGLAKEGNVLVPTKNIPRATEAFLQKLRNVKYYEAMYELLAKQYEMARIDEVKDAVSIQILDSAVPAEVKSKPNRGLIVISGFLAGGFLALFYVLTQNIVLSLMRDFRERTEANI